MPRLASIAMVIALILGTATAPTRAEDSSSDHDRDSSASADSNADNNKDQKEQEEAPVPDALNFTMKDIDGQDVKLSTYLGKVILMVNVASKCGNTPQYKALEAQYEKYKDKGFVILGFPANNFGGQEPGSNEQIKEFCTSKYDVTFPMFAKVSVKGDDTCPLYKHLTALDPTPGPASGGDITWNFEKFLIDREGKVVARFTPRTKPDADIVTGAIEKALELKTDSE